MSTHPEERHGSRRLVIPMRARSPDEQHRASTPLELLFDLVFVVAVAQAASHLHHGVADAHIAEALIGYAMVFFAIWWAWMNFSWFASAYDTDDIPYRLTVFVQLTGALILAVGVPQAFGASDFRIITIGYVVMRLALVAQWLRAARSDTSRRRTAYFYVLGISVLQLGWVLLLFVPVSWKSAGWIVLVIGELLVPVLAERQVRTPWHPEHIAERYGLFTIIVLGESILSASLAIQTAVEAGDFSADIVAIVAGGLLIVFSMWWLYFERPAHQLLTSARAAFIWGYGHLLVFGAAAAVGAGLAVVIDYTTHHAHIDGFAANAAVAVPVALYTIAMWGLHRRPGDRGGQALLLPAAALLILLTPLFAQAVLLTGIILAATLAAKLALHHKSL